MMIYLPRSYSLSTTTSFDHGRHTSLFSPDTVLNEVSCKCTYSFVVYPFARKHTSSVVVDWGVR